MTIPQGWSRVPDYCNVEKGDQIWIPALKEFQPVTWQVDTPADNYDCIIRRI